MFCPFDNFAHIRLPSGSDAAYRSPADRHSEPARSRLLPERLNRAATDGLTMRVVWQTERWTYERNQSG